MFPPDQLVGFATGVLLLKVRRVSVFVVLKSCSEFVTVVEVASDGAVAVPPDHA